MHIRQRNSGFQIQFFKGPVDRELNGESEYRVPVLQNAFLAELKSKCWEGPKTPKKPGSQKRDHSFCCREFRALKQRYSDSALKPESNHVTFRALGQKMEFFKSPKPKGPKWANRFSKTYLVFLRRSQTLNSHIVGCAGGSSTKVYAPFFEIWFFSRKLSFIYGAGLPKHEIRPVIRAFLH